MVITVSRLMFPVAPDGELSGVCSVCGLEGPGQYDRNEILDKTSANLSAIFAMNHPTMCQHCVAIWREPKKYHRAVYADPHGITFPVISRDSATTDRPTWSDLIRRIPADRPRVLVLTTDPKKRIWPLARVSQGDTCCIYLHDPSRGISGNLWVSLQALVNALALIENAYNLGFSKPAIAESLYSSHKVANLVGLAETQALENRLGDLRGKSEFIPALIIAQKEEH